MEINNLQIVSISTHLPDSAIGIALAEKFDDIMSELVSPALYMVVEFERRESYVLRMDASERWIVIAKQA